METKFQLDDSVQDKVTISERTFNEPEDLTVKKQKADSSQSKTCPMCFKTFTKTYNLNRHIMGHSGMILVDY